MSARRTPIRGDEVPERPTGIPPPGPKSRAAAKRLRRVEGAAIWGADREPIVWVRGKGSIVEDADGNRYLDLTSGFGVATLGHAAPEVVRAVAAQARRLMQGLGDLSPHAARERLVRRLSALGGRLSTVLLAGTGSEAVELALKTAALHTGRRRVVAFRGAYHGQSGAALEATDVPPSHALTKPAGPPRAIHVPYPDPIRCPVRRDCNRCDLACLEAGWEAVEAACRGGDPPGAVIVEPIQGRAGVIVPPPEFLPRLKSLARGSGMLLIADEILTGAGRTGPFWAWERSGIEAEPDLMTAGKGLGAGVAIAALFGKREIMDAWMKDAPASGEAPYASTYYAHPLACAGTLAAVAALAAPETRGEVEAKGRALAAALAAIAGDGTRGVAVRSAGLLAAVEFVSGDRPAKPDAPRARAVLSTLARSGVLAIPGGLGGSVITTLPSYRISRAQLEEAARRLEEAVAAVPRG